MAQSRSTKIISMMKWIRISRLSIKNSLFDGKGGSGGDSDADREFILDFISKHSQFINLVQENLLHRTIIMSNIKVNMK